MADEEARKAAIRKASRQVRSGNGFMRRAGESPSERTTDLVERFDKAVEAAPERVTLFFCTGHGLRTEPLRSRRTDCARCLPVEYVLAGGPPGDDAPTRERAEEIVRRVVWDSYPGDASSSVRPSPQHLAEHVVSALAQAGLLKGDEK